ncbi:hypothetical protein PFISCL1PPCAC_1035, partial [Pristionchus fissidentatus]
EAEKIALIKLQWDDPPNKLDKEFWSALIPPRCCPRGCGPIEGKTERFNHYRKCCSSTTRPFTNWRTQNSPRWKSGLTSDLDAKIMDRESALTAPPRPLLSSPVDLNCSCMFEKLIAIAFPKWQ